MEPPLCERSSQHASCRYSATMVIISGTKTLLKSRLSFFQVFIVIGKIERMHFAVFVIVSLRFMSDVPNASRLSWMYEDFYFAKLNLLNLLLEGKVQNLRIYLFSEAIKFRMIKLYFLSIILYFIQCTNTPRVSYEIYTNRLYFYIIRKRFIIYVLSDN